MESDHFGIEQLYFKEQIYEELTLFLTQGSFSCHIHPISSWFRLQVPCIRCYNFPAPCARRPAFALKSCWKDIAVLNSFKAMSASLYTINLPKNTTINLPPLTSLSKTSPTQFTELRKTSASIDGAALVCCRKKMNISKI